MSDHPAETVAVNVDDDKASYGSGEHPAPEYSAGPDANDPPPSYEVSVYGKLKAAKEQNSSPVDLSKEFAVIICGSIGCWISLVLTLAIPIAMIVIGAIYKDDCPAERYIPIFLIVAGSFHILQSVLNLGCRVRNKPKEGEEAASNYANPLDGIIGLFLLAWFIAGNVWVYGLTDWSKNEQSANFCDPTLYYFAFWLITCTYIFMALCCLGGCCVICLAAKTGNK